MTGRRKVLGGARPVDAGADHQHVDREPGEMGKRTAHAHCLPPAALGSDQRPDRGRARETLHRFDQRLGRAGDETTDLCGEHLVRQKGPRVPGVALRSIALGPQDTSVGEVDLDAAREGAHLVAGEAVHEVLASGWDTKLTLARSAVATGSSTQRGSLQSGPGGTARSCIATRWGEAELPAGERTGRREREPGRAVERPRLDHDRRNGVDGRTLVREDRSRAVRTGWVNRQLGQGL